MARIGQKRARIRHHADKFTVKGAPVSAMRCENVLLRGADGRETEEYRKICHWEA